MSAMTSTVHRIRPETCDKCGVRAYVRVVLESGNLDFCGHHYTALEEALQGSALYVFDYRGETSITKER